MHEEIHKNELLFILNLLGPKIKWSDPLDIHSNGFIRKDVLFSFDLPYLESENITHELLLENYKKLGVMIEHDCGCIEVKGVAI